MPVSNLPPCDCEPTGEVGVCLTHSLDCALVRAMYTPDELAQIRAGQRAETRTVSAMPKAEDA